MVKEMYLHDETPGHMHLCTLTAKHKWQKCVGGNKIHTTEGGGGMGEVRMVGSIVKRRNAPALSMDIR